METHGKNKDQDRPAEADEKPVGAGHVRDGVMGIPAVRVLPGHPREVHIHGIFRQNSNKRHDGNSHGLRDIHFRSLAGPCEHERSAENGKTGQNNNDER